MPNNTNKSNYRKKRRSCPLCKPNKTHGSDSRTLQQKRADEKATNMYGEELK